MPSIFVEPISTEGWTAAQHQVAAAILPPLKVFLIEQMRNQPACDRFYDAQRAITKTRHIAASEWQAAVRLPVLESLGYRFDGPDAPMQRGAVYHMLGAATCLNWSFPAGRLDGPIISRAIEKEAGDLANYLVTLGVREQDLDPLLELCKRS